MRCATEVGQDGVKPDDDTHVKIKVDDLRAVPVLIEEADHGRKLYYLGDERQILTKTESARKGI